MRIISIILLSLFVLLGCGRKGALFLPPQTTVQQISPEKIEQPGNNEKP